MIEEADEFHLLFIKATELPESYSFGLVFSQPVNPDTINNEILLLNENKILLEKIRFSKNYRTVNFFIDKNISFNTEENIKLIIKSIESITGNKIEPVIIKNFQLETDYKLMRKF